MKAGTHSFKAGIAVIAAAVVSALFFTACPDGNGGWFFPELYPSEQTASRQVYMGGSLVYTPADESVGNLRAGVVIAVRFSRISNSTEGGSFDTDVAYGYLIVDSVTAGAIVLRNFPVSEEADVDTNRVIRVLAGQSRDFNGDGKPDVIWQQAPYSRDGMEGAMWLTFVDSLPSKDVPGYVWMYSILENDGEDTGGSDDSGVSSNIMGINPDGRVVFAKYGASPSLASFRGAAYGDIVVDTKGLTYAVLSREPIPDSEFRLLASQAAASDGTVVGTARGGDTNKKNRQPLWYTEEQFEGIGSPEAFWVVLPEGVKPIGHNNIPAIDNLNTLLRDGEIEDIVQMVSDSVLNDSSSTIPYVPNALVTREGYEASVAALKAAAASGKFADYEKVAALRNLFYVSYPPYCPAPPVTSAAEHFPLLAVNFGETPSGVLTEDVVVTSYTDYETRKQQFYDAFGTRFTEIWDPDSPFGLDGEAIKAMKAAFDTFEVSVKLGLYGKYTSYWGKMEATGGIVTLLIAEGQGAKVVDEPVKVSTTAYLQPAALVVNDENMKIGVVADRREDNHGVTSPGITLGLEVDSTVVSQRLFAGYIGLYGAEVCIGTDYGASESWGAIPYPDPSFTPYSWGTPSAGSVYYIGPAKDVTPGSFAAASAVPNYGHLYFKPSLKTHVMVGVDQVCSVEGSVETAINCNSDFYQKLNIVGGSATTTVRRDLDISAESGLVLEYDDYCYKVLFDE